MLIDPPKPPLIRTPRLTLRAMTVDDAIDMLAYASDPDVAKYVTWPAHTSVEDSRQFLLSVVAGYEQGNVLVLGIELNATGRMIGTIGAHDVRRNHKRCELGWAVGKSHWNRGYMTEAAGAFVDHLFLNEDFHRLEATHFPGNVASSRVMEKVGMTYEGTRRDVVFVKGEFKTLAMYAILKPDWAATRTAVTTPTQPAKT